MKKKWQKWIIVCVSGRSLERDAVALESTMRSHSLVASNNATFRISRHRTVPSLILALRERTRPSRSGFTSVTTAYGYLRKPRRFSSQRITRSPTLKFLCSESHFCRSWSLGRYSDIHLSHHFSAMRRVYKYPRRSRSP